MDPSTPWVEQALEHDFASALLDTLGALVCVIDREGRIVRFNRASEEVSGYTLAEVRDRPFWDLLIPPDEVEGVREVVRFLVDQRLPNSWENHWITKSGERRYIRWSNTVLCDGDRFAWIIGTGIDVTEERRAAEERDRLLREEQRARAQAELAERRAQFLAAAGPALQGAVPDEAAVLHALARHAVPFLGDWCAVRVVDEHGMTRAAGFAHADPEIERRLGPLDQSPILSRGGVPLVVPNGIPVVVNGAAAAMTAILEGSAELPPEQVAQSRERLRVAGLTSYMAAPLAVRGRIFGAVLFGSAHEERTYGPEDVVLADALAVRAALAADNARLYREAKEALSVREDFLVAASHELKTPLTSLQLAVQALLARAKSSGEPPWGEPLLGAVQRASRRLGELVDDVLDIAWLTTNVPAPALDMLDLLSPVVETVTASAEALHRAGCTPRIEVQGECVGRWDPRWLRRIVAHLLGNATKYGAGQPVEIGVEGGADGVRLTVRDHGIGIPPALQARIFACCERAAPIRHYGGLGLGLWLARCMVEALGGAITVESRPDEGATFTVALPREARVTETAQPE